MNDFSFCTPMTRDEERLEEIRDRIKRTEDARREGLRIQMKNMKNNAERVIDYLRDLQRGKSDVTEEFKEFEAFGHSVVLMVALLKREAAE